MIFFTSIIYIIDIKSHAHKFECSNLILCRTKKITHFNFMKIKNILKILQK